MIEIKYPQYEYEGVLAPTLTASGARLEKEDVGPEGALVSSGIFVRAQDVQAVAIRERRPPQHHPSSDHRESFLELTLEGGATVCVSLYCPRSHRDHALKAALFVTSQLALAR